MKKVSLFLTTTLILSTTLIIAQNNSLDFDGTDDYITCDVMELSNASFSIEGWFKADDFPVTGYYHLFGMETFPDAALCRINNARQLEFIMGHNEGTKSLVSSTILEAGKWYHAAIHYDWSSGYMRIIINGKVDTQIEAAPDGSFNYSNALFDIGGNSGGRYFNGQIDEVKVWEYDSVGNGRTEATIRADMYKEIVGNEPGLVAYYKLNEASGTNANNAKNSPIYDGILTNMTGTEWVTSSAFYGPKNAMHFNLDDYISISSIFGLGTTSVTLECWVNPITVSEGGAFVHIGNDNTGYGIGMGNSNWDDKGNQLIILYDLMRWIETGVTIGTGWHHIVLTIDANGHPSLFLNGKNVYSDTLGTPLAPSGNSSIGSSQGTKRSLSNGIIDEVRIWSEVRTEAEIRENMSKTLIGNETNLVGYYNLDGPAVVDMVGNYANDGAIGGDGDESVASTAFNTWLNTGNSDWTSALNWSNGVPISTDNVGIYSYSSSSPILTATPTINNLFIENGAGLTLSSDFTVNGNLFLNDNLNLNGQTITLGNSSTLYEDNGLISGDTGTITTTRDLNNINENIAGLGVTISTASNMGSTTITRGHTIQTYNSNNSIKRYYDITPTINTGLNASLTFNYDDSELNSSTESNLNMYKSIDGGSSWTNEIGTLNTTNNTITLTGVDGFSKWTIAEGLTLSLADNIIQGFVMYPNPTEDVLNLNAQEEIKKVKIFNVVGQQLYEKLINSRDTTLNLSFLPVGNYFINIYTKNTVKSEKIIIL